jgi:hypothetical protein
MSRRGYNPFAPLPGSSLDPYRGVVIVLLALALLGTAGALAGGAMIPDPLLLDAAVTLGIASGIFLGVALAQAARARPLKSPEAEAETLPAEQAQATPDQNTSAVTPAPPKADGSGEDWAGIVRRGTATAGAAAIVIVLKWCERERHGRLMRTETIRARQT